MDRCGTPYFAIIVCNVGASGPRAPVPFQTGRFNAPRAIRAAFKTIGLDGG